MTEPWEDPQDAGADPEWPPAPPEPPVDWSSAADEEREAYEPDAEDWGEEEDPGKDDEDVVVWTPEDEDEDELYYHTCAPPPEHGMAIVRCPRCHWPGAYLRIRDEAIWCVACDAAYYQTPDAPSHKAA